MLSLLERETIVKLARRYKVKRMFLFGSNLRARRKAQDIDLAVEGVVPSKFFALYSDLYFSLPKPVDLVDLTHDNPFHRMIREDGLVIYGKS